MKCKRRKIRVSNQPSFKEEKNGDRKKGRVRSENYIKKKDKKKMFSQL